ncbi:MAG: hypothetical protein JNM76_06010 [Betaproteobacteria bacterium]|nr:hypothetical protein [Betaproteobacteria bacterium]
MLDCLRGFYRAHGGAGLLAPGLTLVVRGDGVSLEPAAAASCIAQVEIRKLFTAICYLAGDAGGNGDVAVPEDALASLATEATSATAAQINKLG